MMNKGSEHRSIYVQFDSEEKAQWYFELTMEALEGEGFKDASEEEPSYVLVAGNSYEVIIEVVKDIEIASDKD